jgi:hypothetical protein
MPTTEKLGFSVLPEDLRFRTIEHEIVHVVTAVGTSE